MQSRRAEHVFHCAAAVVAAGIIFAGFARTFYLRTDAPLPPLFVVHGIVFSSWFVLLIAQAALVAAGRTDWHRRLGLAGAAVATLMIFLGPVVAIRAARHGMSLEFLATPLFDILVFAILIGAGFWYRRKSQTHKRLMLVATIAILPPAIARLPSDFLAGPWQVFGVTDLILVACIAYDTVARRRLHPAFLWGGLLLVASHPLRVALGGTGAWQTFAAWLIA